MTHRVMDSWAAGISAFALLAAAAAAFLSFRSTPNTLVRAARSAARELSLMEDKMVALEGRWAARSKEFEALHEAIMDDVERAEKKRRQAAASAARAAHQEKPDGEINLADKSALTKLALQRGLL